MQKYIAILIAFAIIISSCKKEEKTADAYGNFEATTTTVSAEANGKLLQLDIEEGQTIKKGQLIALIDTTQLVLQKQQLLARIKAVRSKTQDPTPQIDVLKEQKKSLLREQKRVKALLVDNAATPKQLDDINAQIGVMDKRIQAAKRQANLANTGILSEIAPVEAQIKVLEEQINRCYVKNPIDGTILTKLAEKSEIVAFGRPLYRIANLQTITLRAYISGVQLGNIKLNQKVNVLTDAANGEMKSHEGTISWVAEKSEFTPKTIQTKEERVNLVYAIKVKVENDGSLKIGMPGEVDFGTEGE